MPTSSTDKASLNFDKLAQDAQSEGFKTAYVKHCFNAAKDDLAQGDIVDGEAFLSAL
ncbi:hypothetical protein [Rheinheimera baltica]|uniref:hypothetical protein n=1 Tax=Rheinheimera baltica TaxID=67576 RepID=UPI00273FB2FE|nr:hypothetical protein [Rheinheimera baltica]MDP5192002.1 hypothetical protein [Rheinheimera baltica]